MMETKVKLGVMGLTYSQAQPQAFALILGEEDGLRRIPVMIGAIEAQAVTLLADGVKPHRPLTHDLILEVLRLSGMTLREVFIHKIEQGVFYSDLVCKQLDEDRVLRIDARTSDAVALAMRSGCPIYTTEALLQKTAIVIDEKMFFNREGGSGTAMLEHLEAELQQAIQEENYEQAALIRDKMKKIDKE